MTAIFCNDVACTHNVSDHCTLAFPKVHLSVYGHSWSCESREVIPVCPLCHQPVSIAPSGTYPPGTQILWLVAHVNPTRGCPFNSLSLLTTSRDTAIEQWTDFVGPDRYGPDRYDDD